MKDAGITLEPRDWPAGLAALLADVGCVAEGAGTPAYLVGGPVRDLLLGGTLVDVDVTVEGDGIAFAARLAEELGGEVKSHQRFGTAVVVLPPGMKLDVATARRESYPRPGALPEVERGDLSQDLYRRDFTVNSMAMSLAPERFGRLIDPFGGRRDLRAGVVRVLHEGSFADDPTRLYRAVRFEQRFRFVIESRTEEMIAASVASGAVATVSGDRIRNELQLLLQEADPIAGVRRLESFGLVAAVAPGWRLDEETLARLARTAARTTEWKERMLALIADLPRETLRRVDRRLRLPRTVLDARRHLDGALAQALPRLREEGDLAASELVELLDGWDEAAVRLLGDVADSDLVRRRVAEYLETLRHVRPEVTGEDLRALGVTPGPRMGRLLRRARAARLDGEVSDREGELAVVSKAIAEEES